MDRAASHRTVGQAPAEVLIHCWLEIGSNAGCLMRCTSTCTSGRRVAILAGYLVMRVGARFFGPTLSQRVGGPSPSRWPDRRETQSDSQIPSPFPHPFPAKAQRLILTRKPRHMRGQTWRAYYRQTRSTPRIRLFVFDGCRPVICTRQRTKSLRGLKVAFRSRISTFTDAGRRIKSDFQSPAPGHRVVGSNQGPAITCRQTGRSSSASK